MTPTATVRTRLPPLPFKAVIFDMDGLLIGSEPFWSATEIRVFRDLGVPLSEEMARQTIGLRVDEVVRYWYARCPWKEPRCQDVSGAIAAGVAALVRTEGIEKPGARAALNFFKQGRIPMALASSSVQSVVDAVMERLSMASYFKVIYSAEQEPYGKPHPGVYLTTAAKLGLKPEQCLAFEDSPNGVRAAKAAGMICVAVPDRFASDHPDFATADRIISSLEDLNPGWLSELSIVRPMTRE